MAGIDVKMGVSGIAQFKSAMNESDRVVKTLDSALKLTEKQFKATGDQETYMANKSKLLKQQIAEQNNVIKQGKEALAAMEKQGVTPAAKSYQDMQRRVLDAQAALLDMHGALDTVGQSEEETAQKTDKLTSSLNGINKKVSFDAVLNGIGKITDGMEAAARRVEALARDVWQNIVDAATWADDELTLAEIYGIDVEQLQKMQQVAKIVQTPVDAIIKAQQKLKNNMVYGSKEVQEAFETLGVSIGYLTGKYGDTMEYADATDVFWQAGEALKNYGDEVERDAMATKIFGRSWQELRPLFNEGRESYEARLAAQDVVNKERVEKLNELSTALKELDTEYQNTKNTILSELAPAFTAVGNTVTNLLKRFNEYLNTDEGQEKLGELSEAVTELFSGLSDVDFGTAIDSAKGIPDGVIESLKWISEHSGDVVGALKTIGWGFLALKGAEVVGTLAQGAIALKNLLFSDKTKTVVQDTPGTITTGSTPIDILGKFALMKTAMEASKDDPATLWGRLNGAKKYTMMDVVWPEETVQPTGEPKRPRNITGTASAESMQGTVEIVYNELYKAISSYSPELEDAPSMVDFYKNVLEPKVEDFAALQGVVEEDMQSIKNVFIDAFARSFEDDWEGTTGGLLSILQDAIDEKAQGVKLTLDPIIPEDTVGKLQETLNSYDLYIRVNPIMGAISAMSMGVNGSTGGTSRTTTNTSNIYFDKVNVNNGIDADGLAARIAASTRQAMAGFGG